MIEESRRVEAAPVAGLDVPSLFPLLFDQLADSVFVTDAEGVIRYVNHAFELTSGYSRDEAVGQTPRLLKSGIHPREVYEELWATIQGGTPFRFIFGNRKKNGEIYEEGVMISPIRGLDGSTTHYLSMGRVINAFRQNYDVFTLLANSAPAAIYLQRDGKIFFVNEHLTTTLGYEPDGLVGREWQELVVEEDRDAVKQLSAAMIQGDLDAPFEYRVVAGDGSTRWLMSTVRRVVFRGIQSVAGDFVAGYLTDITDRKDAENRLQRALSMYAATIESTTDGIFVVDQNGHLVSRNRRFDQLWNLRGLHPTDVDQGLIMRSMQDQLLDPNALQQMINETVADSSIDSTRSLDLLDGRHIEVYSKPQIIEGRQVGRVWSWRDVTERRRFEAALLRLANHDSITGLLSRRKLQEEIERFLLTHREAPAALLMIDLDGFKHVNDTFGHQAGDQVLTQVGVALAEADCGEIVGRFGGDEFAIFLPGCDQENAIAAANRALDTLSARPYLAGGNEVSLTASIGIATYPDNGKTPDELLSAADLAMYQAKGSGRGLFELYSPRLRQSSHLNLRSDWQAQVRNAIVNRQGKLYAQEAVALQPGMTSIHKLTIRMAGKELSLQEFGPLANQAGLSLGLDNWLLDEAVDLSRRLAACGRITGLGFDLSSHSLGNRAIMERLLELSRVRGDSDASLVLELVGPSPAPGARAAIRRLHKAGYRFKVPDGSAGRLLEIMRPVPIGWIKLDASIVSRVARDADARALVNGLVLLAHSIGAGTLADGVRDAATLEALRQLGVDHARGSHTGRARPAAGLLAAEPTALAA